MTPTAKTNFNLSKRYFRMFIRELLLPIKQKAKYNTQILAIQRDRIREQNETITLQKAQSIIESYEVM